MRGYCGRRRIHPGIPGAVVDDDGRVGVLGDDVVEGSKGTFGERVWDRCPVALARQPGVRRILDARRLVTEGVDPTKVSPADRLAHLILIAEQDALSAVQLARLPKGADRG